MKYLKPDQLTAERKQLSESGNPGNPQGEAGEAILERMNVSHYDFTGWALELINIPDSGNIIDIGCGGGLTLKRLSAESEKSKLFGLDYSEVAVRKTIEINNSDVVSGKMVVMQASLEKMPFEDNYFDFVTSFETFYFWPDHLKNLQEIKRIMKKDSVFLLASEAYDYEGLSDSLRNKMKERGIFNPSYQQYKEYFEAAGFADFKIYTNEKTDWIAVVAKK